MAVFTKNLRKHIFVHPGDQHKLHSAIKIALLKDRKKYSDSLEGALLDVNKIKVVGDRYLIVNGFLSMDVVADFEVFAPTVGMTLEGVINKVNRSHYGCLVMNLFNASLSMIDDSSLTPKEGDTCSFVVTKLVVNGDLLFMRGQMTSVTPMESPNIVKSEEGLNLVVTDTPSVNGDVIVKIEEENNNSIQEKPRKKHRKKTDLEENMVESSEDVHTELPKKHKKKRKSDDYSLEFANNSSIHINSSSGFQNTLGNTKVQDPEDSLNNFDNEKPPKKHKKKHKSKRDHSVSDGEENENNRTAVVKSEVVTPVKNIVIKTEPISTVKKTKVKTEVVTPVKNTFIKTEPISPVKKAKKSR